MTIKEQVPNETSFDRSCRLALDLLKKSVDKTRGTELSMRHLREFLEDVDLSKSHKDFGSNISEKMQYGSGHNRIIFMKRYQGHSSTNLLPFTDITVRAMGVKFSFIVEEVGNRVEVNSDPTLEHYLNQIQEELFNLCDYQFNVEVSAMHLETDGELALHQLTINYLSR